MRPSEVADLLLRSSAASELEQQLVQLRPFLSQEVITALKERVDADKWRDPQRALQAAEVAQAVASFLGTPEASGLALWARGVALHYLCHYSEALRCFQRAEQLYADQQQWSVVARLQVGQVAMLKEMGRYREALHLAHRIRQTCQPLGGQTSRCLAGLEMNLGSVYEQMGDFSAALAAYERARDLFASLGQRAQVARCEINRAVVLEQMDRFVEAERTLLDARATLAQVGHLQEVARADLNLGVLAYRRGQYLAALRYLEQAHRGFSSIANWSEVATVNLYRSFVYRDLNLIEDLILLASQAEQTFAQDGTQWQRALALINQGIGYWRLRAYIEAQERLTQAREILEQQQAHQRLLTLDIERAFLTLEMGQVAAAQALAYQVEQQLAGQAWPALAARLQQLLAHCALAAEPSDLTAARRHAAAALVVAEAHALPEATIEAHALLGRILEKSGQLEAAWRRYQTAIQAVEQLRAGLPLDEFQMSFMEGRLPIYAANLRLTQHLGSAPQLLLAINLAQTAPLLRLAPAADSQDRATDDLGQRLHQLREAWHWQQSKLEGRDAIAGHDVAHLKSAGELASRQQLRQLEVQIAELSRRWQVRHLTATGVSPQATRLGPVLDPATSERFLTSLQERLSPDQALLLFYVVDRQLRALLLTSSQVHLTGRLAETRQLARLLRSWRFHIEHARVQATSAAGLDLARALLTRLHELLAVPLEPYLADREQLYIVLPPEWHDLPLSALYDGQHHWVERYSLAYLSAPEVLLNGSAVQRFQETATSDATILGYSDGQALPFALAEARQVAVALPPGLEPRLLLEEEATLDGLRRASRTSRLLHLATHAIFRPDNPFFSWMRLADGRLTVAELYEISLPQRPLVVLSACETGRGQPRGGGLLGMSRGFLAAGAQGLVVSLWKVADQASAQLMADFYRHLAADQLPAAAATALAQAQRGAAATGQHPFFWAGFVFVQG